MMSSSSREVKEYLSHHHISQLLESVLTGLLFHRPDDPVSFLHSCLITTTQLGGPEAVTWDTFIHLEGHQLSPVPPRTTSGPPILPLPQTKPQTSTPIPPITSKTTCTPSTKPQITPPIPPITPSIPSETTFITPQTPPTTPLIVPPTPPTSTVAPLTCSRSQIPSIKSKTSAEPKVLVPAPRGPAVTPPLVHTERKEPRDTKTFSTDAPTPGLPPPPGLSPPHGLPAPAGLPPSPVQSQLSIDSDSDMTESSGLRQEVSILHPQRPHPLIIFIIGGPGSGKGSQVARLAWLFGLRVISLDELLRRQLLGHASPSRKWRLISEMMGHGELGPQEETVSELRRQLIGQQEVRGFIVDGFPRDIHQALSFQEQVGSPHLVMLLLCSNETLHCRLQRRAAQLGLLGDNSHALRRRLDTFQRDIISIRRYYRQIHLLTQVDADRDEEVVFADLSSVIREKLLLKDSGPADIPECISAVTSVNQ